MLDYISSFSINPENFKSLRRIITGGETVTLKLTNLFNDALYKATGTGLTVAYGPTETTVWVTVWDWTPQPEQGIIPIGKPTANVEVYILDDANIKVTDGDEGEIVIAGKTVGLGYLNREEINKEKFVPNPYREGETMYKTGDKGRILPDGNIEFLGRFDNMVKLNGTRIELSEVEKNILKLDKIKECIVLMKLINNANELVVYFTTKNPEDDEKQIIDEILIVLNSVLPSYSIPNFFVKLDSFLINANGKIDRKNLPTPRGRYFKHDKPFTGPTTETEKKLTNIIEQILNAEHVSIDDPIFNIGVKSIFVTKILILIKNVFNTTISVSEFFQYPTIRVLSLFIDNQITGHSNPFTLLRPGLGSPIFLIPGYLGDQFNFADFVSNYSLKQPLYSIDFSNVKGFDYHTDYLSVFAKELIAHIKTIQPLGPYFFVGYSLGGLIAYEIACQLQQNNNKVALLAIVGSTPPYFREGFYAKYSILRELNIFLKPNLEVILKYFKYRIPHIFRVFNNKVAKSSIELVNNNSQEVTSDTLKNSIDYKEGSLFFKLTFKTSLKFKGDALIIYENLNKTRYSNFNLEEYYIYHIMPMMWKRFVKGKVDVHLINSLHEEILIEPYAAEVAKIIEDYFDKRTQDEILNWVKFKLDIPFKP